MRSDNNCEEPLSKRGRMDMGGFVGHPRGHLGGLGAMLTPLEVEQELMRTQADIPPNHIILITVLNAEYPVNVDIVSKICHPIGKVARIVVFHTGSNVQAFVEFEDIETATAAKDKIHGCDIYVGSCTLKVEFAKTDRLRVKRNDSRTWDYTQTIPQDNSGQLVKKEEVSKRPVLLQGSPANYGNNMGVLGIGLGPHMASLKNNNIFERFGGFGGYQEDQRSSYIDEGADFFGDSANAYQQNYAFWGDLGGGEGIRRGTVFMIYGMEGGSSQFNCQKLFNLFCQYGNIVRITFLKSKEGTAMVEMDSADAVNKAIQYINNEEVFGLQLHLTWSKKAHVQERKPHQLADGSASYVDFSGDRNNRFDTPERAAKNKMAPPTKVLHFYNVPKMEDHEMGEIFTSSGASAPTRIKWFPPKSEKSFTGLCEFESVQEACEALMLANHATVKATNQKLKFPFYMKLCFSLVDL